jgi:hypothetical protein
MQGPRTATILAAGVSVLTLALAAHMAWALSPTAATWGVATEVELQEAPTVALDVSGEEPSVHDHDPVMEAAAGAWRVRFVTDDPSQQQGLISKDHSGFGSGGHFLVAVADGGLGVRMQADSTEEAMLERGPVGTVRAGVEHEAVVTWDGSEVRAYLDGTHLATWLWDRGLQGNSEPVVVGGMQSTSSPGTADEISNPLQGDVTLVEFYDEVPTAETVAAWADGSSTSFELTATVSWSEASDDGEVVAYRWRAAAVADTWGGATEDTLIDAGEVGATEERRVSIALPWDPDGTGYRMRACVRAVDDSQLESLEACRVVDVPAEPEVDEPPTPPDTVDVEVAVDTVMAMAPETDRAWIYARWEPGDGVAWYRTMVRGPDGSIMAWRNENNWIPHDDQPGYSRGEIHPWAKAGFYVERRASAYQATLRLEAYAEYGGYKAWPPEQPIVAAWEHRWTVPASGDCAGYRGQPIECRRG